MENMFVFKWDKIKELFQDKIDEFINELPEGRSSDAGIYLTGDESTIPHGWERAFPILMKLVHGKIAGYINTDDYRIY